MRQRPIKLTKQGVRDLGGGRAARPRVCSPHLPGPNYHVRGYFIDRSGDEVPEYGKRCLKCGDWC